MLKLKVEKITNRNNENGYSFALIIINSKLHSRVLLELFNNAPEANAAKRAMNKLLNVVQFKGE